MAGRPRKASGGFAPLESDVMEAIWGLAERPACVGS